MIESSLIPNMENDDLDKKKSIQDGWPDLYFECLKPVYKIDVDYSYRIVAELIDKLHSKYEAKDYVTLLLVDSRSILSNQFGFTELSMIEIKSLVDICKKISEDVDQSKLQDGHEVVERWILDNYGISRGSYFAVSQKLHDNAISGDRGKDVTEKEQFEMNGQFVDYVRKVRDRSFSPVSVND